MKRVKAADDCSSIAINTAAFAPCGICGAGNWVRYPDPRPDCSLLSDFRILNEPLAKRGCRTCASVQRDASGDHDALFGSYELYAHDVGNPFETKRQRQYARWLCGALGPVSSAFEAGAGNGSLQQALHEFWPSAELWGVEPSNEAVRRSRLAGADVTCAVVTGADNPSRCADIAFAVNVVEHVADPVAFVAGLARHATSRVAVICPDGSAPSAELLFADHLRSLSCPAIAEIFRRAGLIVERQERAPSALGQFLLTIGRKAEHIPSVVFAAASDLLHAERTSYLGAWKLLDDELVCRTGSGSVVCFGAGEAAALLRAYAPRTWSAVTVCTVDGGGERFGSLNVVPYASIARARVLIAVQPAAQERVAARLRADGHEPIRWDDFVVQ